MRALPYRSTIDASPFTARQRWRRAGAQLLDRQVGQQGQVLVEAGVRAHQLVGVAVDSAALPPGRRLGRAMAYQVPSRFGFHVVERWQFSFAQVTKSIQ